MGHRLSRIYTRTGDEGTTGLADGTRVDKHDARIEAIGSLDETNSAIGFLLAQKFESETIRATAIDIQHRLFDAGAELAMPGHSIIDARHVADLETALDALNSALPPLREFILPGGNQAAAACHIARASARRAERCLWRLAEGTELSATLPKWVNRLSDYLFVAARVLARENGGEEPTWQAPLQRPAE
jgi:cob(I)alamin adenosyltransferase